MMDENKVIEQATTGTKVATNRMILGALWDWLAEDLPSGVAFAQALNILVQAATVRGVCSEDIVNALIDAANDLNEQLAETEEA
jgi:hypothetical protein